MKGRHLNKPQTERILRLLIELQGRWIAGPESMDKWIAMDWLDNAIEEALLDFPRVVYLKIFIREVEKRAPISLEIRDKIDEILSLLVH